MKYDLSLMKDSPLKLRIRRVLWAQGFHCPLEVDLSHFDYQDVAQTLKRSSLTDIDVLGIRFEPDLRMTIIIADCKSGRESESNRIFWLKGVMDFFGAQEGIFVKKTLHSQARAIAPRLGIRAIDEKGLDVLEKSLALDTLAIDIGDPSVYSKASSLWGIEIEPEQKPTEKQLVVKYVYQYLQYYYWVIDEYRNIQNLIDIFQRIKSELHKTDIKSKYLVYIGLQRLTLSILRMASNVSVIDLTNIREQSHTYLFGGAFLQRERTQLIDLLNKLSEQNRIGEKIKLEPPYFDELVEIVNRIIFNSLHAIKILQHLDAVMVEYVLGSTQGIERVLGQAYSTDALVLMKRIANMFQKHAGFDEGMFEELRSL
jgi:hypothetical protein